MTNEQKKAEFEAPERFDWRQTSAIAKKDGSFDIDNNTVERAVLADKIALLNILDSMILSIYKRALREASKYFAEYKKYQRTEFATFLRPRIRLRPDSHTCELSWVRLIILQKNASAEDILKYKTKKFSTSGGQSKRIVQRNGQTMTQTIHYKYIKRTKEFSYSPAIFLDQAGWAQREGARLEQCFILLRQQLKEIADIRRKVLIRMHSLDTKFFDLSILTTEDREDLGRLKDYKTSLNISPDMEDEDEADLAEEE